MFITLNELRSLIIEATGGVDDKTARQIMLKYPKGMIRLGLTPDKIKTLDVLDSGTRGVVFDLGNKVLKITNDAAEAKASQVIKGTDNPSLTKYYQIWQFGDTGIYGLIQEKLNKIPDEEGKAFNSALIKTRLPIWIAKSGYDFDKAKEMSKEFLKQDLQKKLQKGEISKDEIKSWMEDVNVMWNKMSREYNMRNLVKTLGELGIKFHDYHAGNIMKRDDGTLVLIDIGMSKINRDAPIKSITESVKISSLLK